MFEYLDWGGGYYITYWFQRLTSIDIEYHFR